MKTSEIDILIERARVTTPVALDEFLLAQPVTVLRAMAECLSGVAVYESAKLAVWRIKMMLDAEVKVGDRVRRLAEIGTVVAGYLGDEVEVRWDGGTEGGANRRDLVKISDDRRQ